MIDVVWWLLLVVAVGWHLRQSVRNWQAASRLIDDDVAAFNYDHGRAVAALITQPLALFLVMPHLRTRPDAAGQEPRLETSDQAAAAAADADSEICTITDESEQSPNGSPGLRDGNNPEPDKAGAETNEGSGNEFWVNR